MVRYLNGKLNDGAEYVAFQRSFDRDGDYESEGFVDFKTEKDHTVTIVVVVVVLVIVIAVIGGGIFFYRRRHSQPGNGEEELALRPQRRGRTLSKKILGRASGAFGKNFSTKFYLRLSCRAFLESKVKLKTKVIKTSN